MRQEIITDRIHRKTRILDYGNADSDTKWSINCRISLISMENNQ